MPASSTLIRPSGPSSDGVVLMLKREGASTWSSRVPGGVTRLDRGQPIRDDGQPRLTLVSVSPGRSRAMTFSV